MKSDTPLSSFLFDTHAHTDAFAVAQWREVAQRSWLCGVRGNLSAGVWYDQVEGLISSYSEWVVPRCNTSEGFLELLQSAGHFIVLPALGLHPMEIARRWRDKDGSFDEQQAREDVNHFSECAAQLRRWIWAIGETGFDAHTLLIQGWSCKQELLRAQSFAFEACVRLATEFKLPLVIHSRAAWQHTVRSIEGARAVGLQKFMIHCYGGPADDVHWVARQGGFASFGGVMTWSEARKVRQACINCPASALLFETDSPDLSPILSDGTRPSTNEPSFLPDILRVASDLRRVPAAELGELNLRNLCNFLY